MWEKRAERSIRCLKRTPGLTETEIVILLRIGALYLVLDTDGELIAMNYGDLVAPNEKALILIIFKGTCYFFLLKTSLLRNFFFLFAEFPLSTGCSLGPSTSLGTFWEGDPVLKYLILEMSIK